MTAMAIERLRTTTGRALRDVRLAALEDAPHAFWAQLADERVYGREKWISFLAAAAWFVARRGRVARSRVAAGHDGRAGPGAAADQHVGGARASAAGGSVPSWPEP